MYFIDIYTGDSHLFQLTMKEQSVSQIWIGNENGQPLKKKETTTSATQIARENPGEHLVLFPVAIALK